MTQTAAYFSERTEAIKLARLDIHVDWYCNSCGQTKPGSEMAIKSKTLCKKCAARRNLLRKLFDERYAQSQRELVRQWTLANKAYIKDYQLFYKYGLTREAFDQKLFEQDFQCGICDKDLGEDIVVDHDHRCCPVPSNKMAKTCGQCVRSLVHSFCNKLEGLCDDEVAVNLLKYRQRWSK